MVTQRIAATDLAVNGGAPVRGADRPLPRTSPRIISPEAKKLVGQVLDSGFTLDLISEFEQAVAHAHGVRYGVALANCTGAIHAAVGGLGLGKRDEVVVSPISDYGSVSGVVIQGAKAVFPDVDVGTGLITGDTVAEVITPRTKAAIAVHFYGLTCDMDPIIKAAKKQGAVVIEYVCQATVAEYKGRKAGSIGDLGCFCFDAGKLLPTDSGAMAMGCLLVGKGFDTFCPLGPVIATGLNPGDLQLKALVNGRERQNVNTSDLLFSVPKLVSYLSDAIMLLPGDVILTGTPAGVGPIPPGDTVEIEISGIGVLRNPVKAED